MGDGAGGGNMIGGDGVAALDHDARAQDRFNGRRYRLQVDEKRRLLNIGAVCAPLILRLVGAGDLVPLLIAVINIAILLAKHIGIEASLHGFDDFLLAGPDIVQVDIGARLIHADRLAAQVDINRAGQRVGDHQRRRRQEVGTHIGADAAAEIAVAAEHRRGHDVGFVNRLAYRLRQRAAVADAGGAAVTDCVEAQGVKMRRQAGFVQVLRDNFGAGRQASLDDRAGASSRAR